MDTYTKTLINTNITQTTTNKDKKETHERIQLSIFNFTDNKFKRHS